MRTRFFPGLLVIVGLGLAMEAAAQERTSAIQCTDFGRREVLINKDVPSGGGTQRWTITYQPGTGRSLGNVYEADGGATFLQCDRTSISIGQVHMRCKTNSSCSATECPGWQDIPSDVSVACSFLTAPCSPLVITGGDNSRTCTNMSNGDDCYGLAERYGCCNMSYEDRTCSLSLCSIPVENCIVF